MLAVNKAELNAPPHSVVGDSIVAENASWSFSGLVPGMFDEHIGKSVPMYQQGRKLVANLSDFFVCQDSLIYDIGCSTGTMISELAKRHSKKNVRCVGIDVEIDMIRHASDRNRGGSGVGFVHADIDEFSFERTDFVLSYYTMQFVRPKYRQSVVDRVYTALNWGGAFILFEKVRANDARSQSGQRVGLPLRQAAQRARQ